MRDGLVKQAERFKKRIASLDTSDYKVVSKGQLVVGFPINEGVLDFQLHYEEAVVSPAYGIWDIRDERDVDRQYLRRYLTSPHAIEYYVGKMKGSTARRRSLPATEFNAMPIPLPTLVEQRRIAEILDRADAIRAKRRQVLAHLDSLTQSIFHNMFGHEQARVPLSNLVDEFRYGTSNKSGEHGLPTLRIPNVIGGGIDHGEIKTVDVTEVERERLALLDGDVLFVRTNGNPDNVGRCAVFTESAVSESGFVGQPWIYASYLIRARLTRPQTAQYLATYLATPEGRKNLRDRAKTSAGQYNVNIDGIGSVPVPDIGEHENAEFTARLARVNQQRQKTQRALAADDELFASLQYRAFRGEL